MTNPTNSEMTWQDTSDPSPGDTSDTALGLWPGDTGTLGFDSRRTMVQLLRGPCLSADKHPNLWKVLLTDHAVIRSRLADLFLVLVIDEATELAYIKNAAAPDLEVPTVVRTAQLTFLQTAMVLQLRQMLLREGETGRVFVGLDELVDQLDVYRAQRQDDRATFVKRVSGAWTRLRELGILSKPNSEGRAEVLPVLRLVLGPDVVESIAEEFRLLAQSGPATLDLDAELADLVNQENADLAAPNGALASPGLPQLASEGADLAAPNGALASPGLPLLASEGADHAAPNGGAALASLPQLASEEAGL